MPRGDGTGPLGRGPIMGGGGAGRGPGRFAAGPGGYCVCPKCGEQITHVVGVACSSIKCPKCGALMTRSI